jgi:hypothetical protein
VANCSPEDWQYVMDVPALYSLVHPDGQECDVMLTEESNSSKAGYASSAQARLSLSFITKVPGIFGADRLARNGRPFSAISEYSKWESTGIKRSLWDQVEEGVKALEASLSKRMSVHMPQKVEARRIFLTLLTDSFQQILKLHRTMDAQFQRYRGFLGIGCDESNWILKWHSMTRSLQITMYCFIHVFFPTVGLSIPIFPFFVFFPLLFPLLFLNSNMVLAPKQKC